MSALIYAHPSLSLDDIRRIWQQHGLVAVSRPTSARRPLVVELRPLPRPQQPAQVLR